MRERTYWCTLVVIATTLFSFSTRGLVASCLVVALLLTEALCNAIKEPKTLQLPKTVNIVNKN